MPQVPYVDHPQVNPQGGLNVTAPAEAFGSGVASAIGGLGKELEKSSDVLAKHALHMQDRVNQAHETELFVNSVIKVGELDTKLRSLEGKDAATFQKDQYIPGLKKIMEEAAAASPNPEVRRRFESDFKRRVGYSIVNSAGYAATQLKHYENKSTASRIEMNKMQAAVFAQDDKLFQDTLNDNKAQVEILRGANGWSPEQTQLEQQKEINSAWERRLRALADTNPMRAKRLFKENRAQITGDFLYNIDKSITQNLIRVGTREDAHQMLSETDFEKALTQRESGGDPSKVNQFGYAGKYQFGAPRLAAIGMYTPGDNEDLKGWSKTARGAPGKWSGTFDIPGFPQIKTIKDFLGSPAAQKAAFDKHIGKSDEEADAAGLNQYIGQTVAGVPITKSGLRAMQHLGGTGGAAAVLKSGGADNPKDANETSLLDYARMGSRVGDEPGAEIKLADLKARAKARGEELFPNDPAAAVLYEDTLMQRIESDHSRSRKVAKIAELERRHIINAELLDSKKLITSVEELSPKAQQVYNDADPVEQKRFRDQMIRNSKADVPLTQAARDRFQILKGMASDPEQRAKFAELDIKSEELLPHSLKEQLFEKQREIEKVGKESTKLSSAMEEVSGLLTASKIWRDRESPARLEKYNKFRGQFDESLREWQLEKKRFPTAAEQRQIAAELLRKDVVPGRIWGTNEGPAQFEKPRPVKAPRGVNYHPDFPIGAQDMLRGNPELAPYFDKEHGAGAAAKVLGK